MININDSPPRFSQVMYETVLLLPTYVGVQVIRVDAFDPDTTPDLSSNPDKSGTPPLLYSLVENNVDFFSVEPLTGVVTVVNPNLNKDSLRFGVKVTLFSACPVTSSDL